MLTIPIMAHIKVDGTMYAYTWHDFGSYMRLRIFRDDRVLGHKDFPISTDQGQGVIEYSIRSLLKGANNGLSQKVAEA
jgi:hypothetical protein